MNRVMLLCAVIFVTCATRAQAQDVPRVELSGGYSYLDGSINSSKFHLNGGFGSVTENMNSWFGGRVEFFDHYGTARNRNGSGQTVTSNVGLQTITYGPVLAYRRSERVTPFIHAQIGAAHGSQGYLNISQAAFKFALSSGAGLDLNINHRASLRLQGDYLMTRFLAQRQDNLQFSAGFVVRLGRR